MAGHYTPTPGGKPQYTAAESINMAAQKWGVPIWVMIGVWGVETDFGRNVTTSSAGAVGDFQFIPSTAAGYNYPLTNSPSHTQFAQQADAAAHLLHDNFKKYGSWDRAIHAYSSGTPTGGYGAAEVQAKFKQAPGAFNPKFGSDPVSNAVGSAATAVGNAISAPFNALGDIAKVLSFIFSFQFLYVIGGGFLVLLALYLLAKQTGTGRAAISGAKGAAMKAAL